MKIREYITKISENKKIEDMKKLGDMLADIIYSTKDTHPELYDKYKTELYEMAYGKVLTEEKALNIIENMKPYGMKWKLDETKQVQYQYGINNISPVDFWIVMNSAYNDYYNIFEEDLDLYVKYTQDFILDEDSAEDKVYLYYTKLVKK